MDAAQLRPREPLELPLDGVRPATVDRDAGDVGCAVQSKYFSVGSVVPWAKAGVGAVATQAAGVAVYGPRALALLEEAGVDAIHVSAGSTFPHPDNPAGGLPLHEVVNSYDTMISSGAHAFRNYLLFG